MVSGRRWDCLAVVAVGAFVLALAPSMRASAAVVRTFEGVAFAAPVYGMVDRTFLFHPVASTNLFPSRADVNSSGVRSATAGLVDPGPAQTAGALAGQLVPSELNVNELPVPIQLPIPELPLPPIPLPDVPVPAPPNPPITVTAAHPTAPERSIGAPSVPLQPLLSGGAVGATARADSNSASARAEVARLEESITGFVSIGGAWSEASTSVNEAGVISGRAESRLTDVTIAGVLEIGAIESVTEFTGAKSGSTSTSQTTIGAVTALGFPATIDAEGVHVVGEGTDLTTVAVRAIEDQLLAALDAANISVRLLPEGATVDAPADGESYAETTAGALIVEGDIEAPPEAGDVPGLGPLLTDSPTKMELVLGFSRGRVMHGPDEEIDFGNFGPISGGAPATAAPGSSAEELSGPSSTTGAMTPPTQATGPSSGGLSGTSGSLAPPLASGPPSVGTPDVSPPQVAAPPPTSSGDASPTTPPSPPSSAELESMALALQQGGPNPVAPLLTMLLGLAVAVAVWVSGRGWGT